MPCPYHIQAPVCAARSTTPSALEHHSVEILLAPSPSLPQRPPSSTRITRLVFSTTDALVEAEFEVEAMNRCRMHGCGGWYEKGVFVGAFEEEAVRRAVEAVGWLPGREVEVEVRCRPTQPLTSRL